MRRFLGLFSAVAGVGVLVWVVYPIVGYEFMSMLRFGEYLSPIPVEDEGVYAKAVEGEMDLTKASNWFVGDPPSPEAMEVQGGVRFYTLSIPVLKIKNAAVAVGGEDLSESLIQYPGTAYPGKRGNGVVFGHSVLPQFFNPEDYLTIFSTLPRIEKGDMIEANYDGINYQYAVEDIFEVGPTDIEILAQNTDDSYLTLVTCVPPGHPLRPKRLIVRARLVQLGERTY